MVLNQTHSEMIVKNLGSVKQVRGKGELSPLVNSLNSSFRTTVSGEHNITAIFFPFLL